VTFATQLRAGDMEKWADFKINGHELMGWT
jgi:hypothetical protein